MKDYLTDTTHHILGYSPIYLSKLEAIRVALEGEEMPDEPKH